MSKIKTAKMLFHRFREDTKEFSFSVAFGRLVRDLPFIKWDKRRTFYEKQVTHYLEKNYLPALEKCIKEHREENCVPCSTKQIWVMWWQGADGMPPIVRACYEQLLKVSDGCSVTLITKDNYRDYVDLPDYILQKQESGQITLTHFSDIIRAELLKRWGGAWLDATIYAQSLPEKLFTSKFYTLRAPGLFPDFVSRGKWSTFLLATDETNSIFFECLLMLFYAYWETHLDVIDYIMFDFFIDIMEKNSLMIAEYIKNGKENCNYYGLNLAINEAHSSEKWRKIFSSSPLQKLTYKKAFYMETPKAEKTNYAHIIGDKI